MQLDTIKTGDVLVVTCLEERLDAKVSAEFIQEMALFIKNGNQYIVLDISNINFIDSSGLGAIVASLKQLGDKGDLAICGINKSILSMFRITRLDRVVKIFSEKEEALSQLTR